MGANLPPASTYDTPSHNDIFYATGRATGNVNIGDFLIYSGHWVIPTAMATNGSNAAAVKASAFGLSLGANPVYDSQGVAKQNTGLLGLRQGRYMASSYYNASASGDINLGVALYPATTGSGVNAPTGLTGVGAQWATADRKPVSGTAAPAQGIATLIGIRAFGTGSGKTQLEVLLAPARPDYY